MFAQLFLGFYFTIKGIVEHYAKKPNLFISNRTIESISDMKLGKYLKSIGKIHNIFGIVVVGMGQVEHWYGPRLWTFSLIYIAFGVAFISGIAYVNNKYSGNYILK